MTSISVQVQKQSQLDQNDENRELCLLLTLIDLDRKGYKGLDEAHYIWNGQTLVKVGVDKVPQLVFLVLWFLMQA